MKVFRSSLQEYLARLESPLRVDIGFGDVVTPHAEPILLPTLLEQPRPLLRLYPRETVIAEKCEAMVDLGLQNSRFKDFFDIWYLATHYDFEADLLCRAVGATFTRRGTPIPLTPPSALTEAFFGDPTVQIQWQSFLRKSGLASARFEETIALLRNFLLPVFQALSSGTGSLGHWSCRDREWSGE